MKLYRVCIVLACLLIINNPCFASTFYVDCDAKGLIYYVKSWPTHFLNIQTGINDVNNGNVVVVADEYIDATAKRLLLLSGYFWEPFIRN